MTQHILLLEDDPNLGFVLQEHLEANGFRVTLKTNGEEGLSASRTGRFDLCLVDVMMPKKDGFTFAREFRAADAATPIIFLTAKSLKEDRIEGFRAGGDDYVTKPFSMEELRLRIQAVLRRSSAHPKAAPLQKTFAIGSFLLDTERQLLTRGRGKRTLTDRETALLALLAANQNAVLLRSDILNSVWEDETYYTSRSLDVFISRLRKYLAADPAVSIKSVHSKGYKLAIAKQGA